MEQSILRNAPTGNEFVLRSGRVLKNLHELANALVSMDDETFSHHVTKEKNDFSNWIQGVFSDEKLAKQILKIRNREGIRNRLNEALKEQAKLAAAQLPKKEEEKQTEKPSTRKQILQKIFSKRKQKEPTEQKASAPQQSSSPMASFDSKTSAQIAEMGKKLEEVLRKEREIEFKEKKLLEIEQKIERKILSPGEHHFFTKEFVQGIVTGFLVTLIVVLIYAKFVLQV